MHALPKIFFMSGLGLVLAAGTVFGQESNSPMLAGSSITVPRPAAVIGKASKDFINALKRHKVQIKKDPREAQRLVHEYILPHFDLKFTTRLILGRYWETATPSQRNAFSRAFINHLIAVYEKGIVSYRKDRVQVLPLQGGTTRQFISVDTLVHIPGHDSVSVNYAMHKVKGKWKIFDVKVMGISFVLTYRNEYQAEIRRTSLAALIKHLRKTQLSRRVAAIAPSLDN